MKIHRFKCSQELNQEIMNFSDIHKFDIDETLAEHFKDWMERHKELIEREEAFLKRHDYDDKIESKIFKSIKYYYIKKFIEKAEPPKTKRKEVQKIDPTIMKAIKDDLMRNFGLDPNFKPSATYERFKTTDDPCIKKSYKNQYYQMKNKRYNINAQQLS